MISSANNGTKLLQTIDLFYISWDGRLVVAHKKQEKTRQSMIVAISLDLEQQFLKISLQHRHTHTQAHLKFTRNYRVLRASYVLITASRGKKRFPLKY